MEFINFNSAFTLGSTGNWIADIISWLVNGTSVAVGIIIFTLILKAITLPFDVLSRVSMRKNSLKMEEMRPELERLQKQYANDKTLYNQKMMALYKKNGYSMWGACLPTILTLVIFIVAINGFTTYSQYKNREYFYDMTNAYNNVIYAGFDLDGEHIYRNDEGKLVVDDGWFLEQTIGENPKVINLTDNDGNPFTVTVTRDDADPSRKNYTLKTENGYAEYKKFYVGETESADFLPNPSFTLLDGKIENVRDESGNDSNKLASKDNNYLLTESGKSYSASGLSADEFMKDIRRSMAANRYYETKSSFLWVKNIWVTDSPMAHPISDKAQNVNAKASCDCKAEQIEYLSQANYDELTYKLSDEKSAPNGYFILVVLTAATSLFMQLVMSKSQKAQMELQTVDGQGAQTQKMMTWMMPIMMAVFAFLYTSAFSIYIILSSLISVVTTLLTNYFVGKKFDKIKATNSSKPVRGRIYSKPEENKEKPSAKKGNEVKRGDFLNSEKENRKIRRGK
ncbi:MAG: YidC/Oxa1 family membrane protein insertase [Clostridia bacterium]|nr:YidC/Oxa1 family membrane protein insertase [Clostridia bacterium]